MRITLLDEIDPYNMNSFIGIPRNEGIYCLDCTHVGQLVIDIAQELGCAMIAIPNIRSHSPIALRVNQCVFATLLSLPGLV